MLILVDIEEDGDAGWVTLVPNWFERLVLRERTRRGRVTRIRNVAPSLQTYDWKWAATERDVGSDIERAIEASIVSPTTLAIVRT